MPARFRIIFRSGQESKHGFGAYISGNRLHIKYHAEIPLKEVHSNNFESEMESMVEQHQLTIQITVMT